MPQCCGLYFTSQSRLMLQFRFMRFLKCQHNFVQYKKYCCLYKSCKIWRALEKIFPLIFETSHLKWTRRNFSLKLIILRRPMLYQTRKLITWNLDTSVLVMAFGDGNFVMAIYCMRCWRPIWSSLSPTRC